MSRGGANVDGHRLVSSEAPPRILSRDDCLAIFQRVRALAKNGGDTTVEIGSWWQGEVRWGRNRVSLASDRRDVMLKVTRTVPANPNGIRHGTGFATTNQFDDISIEAAVRAAERSVISEGRLGKGRFDQPLPEFKPPAQAVWSDATYNLTTEERSKVAQGIVGPAEAKGLLSAGYIEVRAGATMTIGTDRADVRKEGKVPFWEQPYVRWTQAQCSMTVRNQKGTGSGWAGLSSFDWPRIDTAKLTERALMKCVASEDPVALEPGRYTVILEPEAVADLVEPLMGSFEDRGFYEMWPTSVWGLRKGFSKIGLKVMDDRITISHNPGDSNLGIIMAQSDTPEAVTWVEKGVLTYLGHSLEYGVESLAKQNSVRGTTGYKIEGGPTSIEEMIRTTKRGLLVTRFSNVALLNRVSYLETGLTRDGLWLIEDGKITKSVKNFRFTESPLFMLNSLEQIGESVPVFRPTRKPGEKLTPAIVPAMKARDFSFTAMIDGV